MQDLGESFQAQTCFPAGRHRPIRSGEHREPASPRKTELPVEGRVRVSVAGVRKERTSWESRDLSDPLRGGFWCLEVDVPKQGYMQSVWLRTPWDRKYDER